MEKKGDSMDGTERAEIFATKAHAGQNRKYGGEPYISHPRAVVNKLRTALSHDETAFLGMEAAMLRAAWLHDVVEDCDCTLDEIQESFGFTVRCLVSDLTDFSVPTDGNRAARKSIDVRHTSRASPEAQYVKLCDVWHNTIDICEHDPKFARRYILEKRVLLDAMSPRVKATELFREVDSIARYYERKFKEEEEAEHGDERKVQV